MSKEQAKQILEKHISLYFSSHHDKSRWNGEWENGGAEWHAHNPIAEDIFRAMEEYSDLRAKDLLEALEMAFKNIRAWHGDEAFDIYYKAAPEMKLIREALASYREGEIDKTLK